MADEQVGQGGSVGSAPGSRDTMVRQALAKLDTTVAHPARVYDYWLGGKDNFAPDRAAAEQVIALNPGIVPGVRNNRAFLVRVVRFLAGELGIRQYLDLGTGLPSANNVHEVAQQVDPQARVVYVDNDPIVLVHAHALLTGTPGTVDYVDSDIHDPATILREAARTLDLDRPVALMLLMTLQFLPDSEEAYAIVSTLMSALPSGSLLVISHPAADAVAGDRATARYNEMVATRMTRRTHAEVSRFFAGLEVLDPGVVALSQWRPDGDTEESGPLSPAFCGVGRKP